ISDIPKPTEPAPWGEPQFPDFINPDERNSPEDNNKPFNGDEWNNRHDDSGNDWNNWNNHENQNHHEDRTDFHEFPEYPDFPENRDGFVPTANNYFVPVLDGYTIINQNTNQYEHNEKEFPDKFPKAMGSIDFFVIMADENGKYVASLNNDDLTADSAQEYINKIISGRKTSGMTGNLSFCTEKKSNGTLIVLTDRTAEMDMMNKLKRTTVIVGIISIIMLSGAGYFLSGLIVRPLRETFDKQKQFISDASHELKTPLTVISANADVLAGEIGENKWLTYIQEQAGRMNILVNDLLSLTRLENKTRDFITTEFDLSRAVENTALPFECQAFESGKNFVINIEEGIRINASEQHIRQMTGIFIDNALKYSKEKGTVRVSLVRDEGKTVLSVYNTGNGVRQDEVDRLFERFYRSDESRNRSTGGYGLGLAIAKSIIDKHNFKIQVENQEGKSICFVVTMN
ncbi:MAG: HAMP domain-containing histidine kinase, partial [Ruminococcus sp.]|nr:HAMP domain-containing histidine kinase [Ruminococcus sp.]